MRLFFLLLAFALSGCNKRHTESKPTEDLGSNILSPKVAYQTTPPGTGVKIDSDLSKLSPRERFQALFFSTESYRREAVRLMVEEANRVAKDLQLDENLPITETNLLERYVTPPRMAQAMMMLGHISTTNYTYYFSVSNKFSFLTRQNLDREFVQLRTEYLWPIERLDTNAAYRLATELLAAVSVDVDALNRDCAVRIESCRPEGKNSKHFVPIYWISWVSKNPTKGEIVAMVELFEPTRTIRQLYVKRAEYILRKPLEITNLDYLLSQTNASPTPPTRQFP